MMSTHIQKTIKKAVARKTSRARLAALSLGALALAALGISQGYAAATTICNIPPPLSLTFPALEFDGGADGPTIGQPIGNGWGAVTTNSNFFNGGGCLISTGITLPMVTGALVQGLTYTEGGISYPIFATSVPGIGIIIGIKATSAANYTPVTRPITNFYPNPTPSWGMGISLHAKLIVTGRLATGVYPIASQNLVRVYANGPEGSNTAAKESILTLNATTVTITARTCEMVGAASRSVPLLPVSKNQFSGVGTTAGAPADFLLTTRCGDGVKLYATMTDGSDAGNTGNTLKPAEGTTASGVGVQIVRDGLPISFGPDSSASGNINQWYIGTANSGGSEVFTIPLKARYVQTEQNMVAGSVKARATVTFSYQ
jgi:type 1 fimbria pilin